MVINGVRHFNSTQLKYTYFHDQNDHLESKGQFCILNEKTTVLSPEMLVSNPEAAISKSENAFWALLSFKTGVLTSKPIASSPETVVLGF